jgi:hypothetical protein
MQEMLGHVGGGEFRLLTVGYYDPFHRNLRRTLEIVEDVLHPNGVSLAVRHRMAAKTQSRAERRLRAV